MGSIGCDDAKWHHPHSTGERAGSTVSFDSEETAGSKAFSREVRLRTGKQLGLMRTDGTAVVGCCIVVRSLAPPPDCRRRVGIVVSRRFSGRAVTRNRARRLLREAYRCIYRDLVPAWVLLIPRRNIQAATIHQVAPELQDLCRKAMLFKPGVGPFDS